MSTLLSVALSALLSLASILPPTLCPLFPGEHERFGVNVAIQGGKYVQDYNTVSLNIGWYIDYAARRQPERPGGIRYLQLVSAKTFPINPSWLNPIIDANPGAIWVLGNEPDRRLLQDSRTPAQYAEFYHHAYHHIKDRDPTALIATAGIVQPTPIRLLYLDKVLAEYTRRFNHPMPVDVWTVHNFILREVRHEWGADIPPDMEEYAHLGKRYTVYDHGRSDLFRSQIIAFRRWMADRGYRYRPLIVSEYGILMPKEYGFGDDRLAEFMRDSFDFFLTATDAHTGYPHDGNRLVQAWGWYSLNDKEFDFDTFAGFNGNLFDHDSGTITPLGRAFADYTAPLVDEFVDLAVAHIQVAQGVFVAPAVTPTATVTVTVVNAGNLPADAVVTLRHETGEGATLLAQQTISALATHCAAPPAVEFSIATTALPAGLHTLHAQISPTGQTDERRPENNRQSFPLYVLAPDQELQYTYLPITASAR